MNTLEDVESAIGFSMEWGYKINEKESQKDIDFDSITTVCKQFSCKVNNATDGSHYSITPPAIERTLVVPRHKPVKSFM